MSTADLVAAVLSLQAADRAMEEQTQIFGKVPEDASDSEWDQAKADFDVAFNNLYIAEQNIINVARKIDLS